MSTAERVIEIHQRVIARQRGDKKDIDEAASGIQTLAVSDDDAALRLLTTLAAQKRPPILSFYQFAFMSAIRDTIRDILNRHSQNSDHAAIRKWAGARFEPIPENLAEATMAYAIGLKFSDYVEAWSNPNWSNPKLNLKEAWSSFEHAMQAINNNPFPAILASRRLRAFAYNYPETRQEILTYLPICINQAETILQKGSQIGLRPNPALNVRLKLQKLEAEIRSDSVTAPKPPYQDVLWRLTPTRVRV